jgi:hypothetical protein
MKKAFLVLLVFILAACSSAEQESEAAAAETTMRTFFSVLANGQYAEAVTLYGGDYEILTGWNPDISPTDYTSPWQRGCEQNGLVCMEIMEIVKVEENETNFEFTVTFKTKGGELFELTGCCGETFPEPISEYVIGVQSYGKGNYKVLSLPPYVP